MATKKSLVRLGWGACILAIILSTSSNGNPETDMWASCSCCLGIIWLFLSLFYENNEQKQIIQTTPVIHSSQNPSHFSSNQIALQPPAIPGRVPTPKEIQQWQAEKKEEDMRNELISESVNVLKQNDLETEIGTNNEKKNDLENNFKVGELIAEGGMAQIYRATNLVNGEIVVWKQAHGKHNPLRVSNERIIEEAELLSQLQHKRIPTVFDVGQIIDSSGREKSVLVIEYIEGGDLKNTVEQFRKMGVPLPFEKAIQLVHWICEPLDYMAKKTEPIYHRDLKPHNIIIHPDLGPVLIDFGLAKQVATTSDLSITRGGSGTWTPPERESGLSGGFTDVWSLGKILYYLLTSEVPPVILDIETVRDVLDKNDRPRWLTDFIIWACWPHHEKRIQNVEQFYILLENQGAWPEKGGVSASNLGAGSDSGDFSTWQ